MMLLSLAMSMFAIGVIGARAREVMSRLDFAAAALMLLWGAGIGSIVAMASAAGVRAYTAANWIVWPAAIAVITHSVAAQADAAPRRRGVLAGWLLGALLVCVSAAHLLTWSYDDGVPWSLHERFQQPRLRGIVSTPTRVREYDGIVTALRSRTSPGDYVLAFDDLWWINYLTDTRPPLRSVLIAPNRFPRALEERWLAEMDSAGRSPRWVVTRRPPVGATPLESFIRTRYEPAALVGDLQLWGIRAAGQPASNDVGAVGGH